MAYLTELEERLAGEGSETLRLEITQKMAAFERNLRHLMATKLLAPGEFERATVLARASALAQNVMSNQATDTSITANSALVQGGK